MSQIDDTLTCDNAPKQQLRLIAENVFLSSSKEFCGRSDVLCWRKSVHVEPQSTDILTSELSDHLNNIGCAKGSSSLCSDSKHSIMSRWKRQYLDFQN